MVCMCHFFHKSVKHNIHHYWIVHLKTNQNSLRTPITLSGLLLFVCLFVLPSGNNLWFICQGLVPISQPGPQSFWGEVWDVAILFLGSLLSVVSHHILQGPQMQVKLPSVSSGECWCSLGSWLFCSCSRVHLMSRFLFYCSGNHTWRRDTVVQYRTEAGTHLCARFSVGLASILHSLARTEAERAAIQTLLCAILIL